MKSKKLIRLGLVGVLSLGLVSTNLISNMSGLSVNATETESHKLNKPKVSKSMFGSHIVFDFGDGVYLDGVVKKVTVNGQEYTKVESTMSLKEKEWGFNGKERCDSVLINGIKKDDKVVFYTDSDSLTVIIKDLPSWGDATIESSYGSSKEAESSTETVNKEQPNEETKENVSNESKDGNEIESVKVTKFESFSGTIEADITPLDKLTSIGKIELKNKELTKVDSKYSVYGSQWYQDGKKLYIPEPEDKAELIITVDGKESKFIYHKGNDLSSKTFEKVKSSTESKPSEPENNTGNNKEDNKKEEVSSSNVSISLKEKGVGLYDGIFTLDITPLTTLEKIDAVLKDGKNLSKVDNKLNIYSGNWYKDDKNIYVHKLEDGNKLAIKTTDGTLYTFLYKDSKFLKADNVVEEKTEYYPILRGSFESALTTQAKYDTISGASLSVVDNKNSNAEVVVTKDKQVYENYINNHIYNKEEWQSLPESKVVKGSDQIIAKTSEDCGMRANYNPFTGAITLAAKNADGLPGKAGDFKVWVEIKEPNGEVKKTNELPFSVYDLNNTYLSEVISKSHPRIMGDGKKIWDMDPWKVVNFDKETETVKIPSDWKAIYGSHESGTYGEIGKDIPEGSATTQKLIIGADTNVTIVNTKIGSGVEIIVEDGGIFNLKDSVVNGILRVRNGGKIQINYEDYHKTVEVGASVNGQIIMEDGGIMENSVIPSNTNFISNNGKARLNEKPIVKVVGNATFIGKNLIRGDESATGKNESGNDILSGQVAFEVADGGVANIEKDGVLIVNGGGQYLTTEKGGSAAIVNGKISGDGMLVAIAGKSSGSRKGSTAVVGNGSIDVAEAVIHGGITRGDKNEGGDAIENTVKLSPNTKASLVKGAQDKNETENIEPLYWTFGKVTKDEISDYRDNVYNFAKEELDNVKELIFNAKDEATGVELSLKVQDAKLLEGLKLGVEEKKFEDLTAEEKELVLNTVSDKIPNSENKKISELYKLEGKKFYNIKLLKDNDKALINGDYELSIPCDKEADAILHIKDNKEIEVISPEKSGNVVKAKVNSLSPFMVLNADDKLTTNTENPTDKGSTTDTENPTDKGSTTDTENPTDKGSTTDAENPTDKGSTTYTENPTDKGSTTDAENPIDKGSTTNTENPTDVGKATNAENPTDKGSTTNAENPTDKGNKKHIEEAKKEVKPNKSLPNTGVFDYSIGLSLFAMFTVILVITRKIFRK